MYRFIFGIGFGFVFMFGLVSRFEVWFLSLVFGF